MDIVETASSNASSEDMMLFNESPKRHKHLDGFYPSHDMVLPPHSARAAHTVSPVSLVMHADQHFSPQQPALHSRSFP